MSSMIRPVSECLLRHLMGCFPVSVLHPEGVFIVSSACDDSLSEVFNEAAWTSIPRDLLRRHFDWIRCLSNEGVTYYIPAFLLAALESTDWHVWCACVGHVEYVMNNCTIADGSDSAFAPDQLRLIRLVCRRLVRWSEAANDANDEV